MVAIFQIYNDGEPPKKGLAFKKIKMKYSIQRRPIIRFLSIEDQKQAFTS